MSGLGEHALSPRQREVLAAAAAGETTQETATRTRHSVHTVRAHRKAALAKLQARTIEQAVAIAIRRGLLG